MIDKIKELDNFILKNNLFGLDFLRSLAIILVLLFHNVVLFPHPEWINRVGKFGWIGVDLFFALSGFLIASKLFEQIVAETKISYRDFFIKRFFRITPLYLVVLTLYFCFLPLRESPNLAPLWKYLTFTQNFGLDRNAQGAFSHAWSLCVEEQFYLFFPLTLICLIYFRALKFGFYLLLSLVVLGFLARLYAWYAFVYPIIDSNMLHINWYKWIYYPTYARLDGLLFGILIAAIFHFKPKVKNYLQAYGNTIFTIGLLVLSAAYIVCLDEKSLNFALWGFFLVDLGCGLLVLSAICPTSVLYQFKSRFFTAIATLSYAIYLIHKITIHVTQEFFFSVQISKDSNTMMLLGTFTTLLAALVLHNLIEKPFMKFRNQILHSTTKS
jgi:peptidoglycan/LPS O-acetylase OafA/YrhL